VRKRKDLYLLQVHQLYPIMLKGGAKALFTGGGSYIFVRNGDSITIQEFYNLGIMRENEEF